MQTNSLSIRVCRQGLTLSAAAGIALVVLAGSGCATADNDRLWLGSEDLTGVVRPEVLRDPGRQEAAGIVDSPSLTGMSRANWGSTTFLVPIDGIATNWTYARHRSYTDTTARQRGAYPDAINAIELSGDTLWEQSGESAMSPLWAVWDFALAIPRPFMGDPNWEEIWTIPREYWRAPATTQRRPIQVGGVSPMLPATPTAE